MKKLIEDFKTLNIFQKIFFIIVIGGFIFYGLLHAGLVKLPAAKAKNCQGVTGKTIEVNMEKGKFFPSDIKAKVCDTLVFINKDSEIHEPAVGPHPTHTSYPGFDAKEPIKPGGSFTFLLNRPG